MTKTEAMRICDWFQHNIGLSGWTFRIFLNEKPSAMSSNETREDIEQQLGQSWAHLRLHDLMLWINPNPIIINDAEDPSSPLTLFHELLHGLFESLNIQYDRIQEHAIDKLAFVLNSQYQQEQTKRRNKK